MKYITLIILLFPIYLFSQNVEVQGDLSITGEVQIMDTILFQDGSKLASALLPFLQDGDNDTKIEVEQNEDEDLIRFTVAGVEIARFENNRLELADGGGSVFIGFKAGENDDATNNKSVYIGYETGQLSNGFANTAVGSNAFQNNGAGDENTALGVSAGYQSGGSNNVFVGRDAGRESGSGAENTYIGHDAGRSANGSGNVLLGKSAGENMAGNNKLAIDNSNTANPLIYGDFESDYLQVNGKLNVNGAYTFPSFDGTAGQVLTTNGGGGISWNTDEDVFENNNGAIRQKSGYSEDFIVGRDALPINGEMVTDTFFFFDKSKGAFRGGWLNNSKKWAPDSIGRLSFAYGYGTRAMFFASFAIGENTTASGYASFASGLGSLASGNFSFASGSGARASGTQSFASGFSCIASGYSAFALGYNSIASGDYSFSSGFLTIASGDYSFAAGQRTFAPSYAEFSMGSYNTEYTPIDDFNWNLNDRLFVIGNGSSENSRSDAMVVLKNGNTGIGTSAPEEILHIKGDLKIEGETNNATLNMKTADGTTNRIMVMQNNGADLIFGDIDGQNQHVYFKSGGLNRMILNNAGNVGIGTFSPSYQLQLSQNSAAKPGSSSWTIDSDKRLKQNIHKYSDGLAQVLAINPVTFQYNDASGFDVNKEYVGIIAQELQGIAPYMVNEKKDGYLTVDNGAMTYMLINAVKEQNELIDDLQKEVLSLKSGKMQSEERFRSLEAKLDALISGLSVTSQE